MGSYQHSGDSALPMAYLGKELEGDQDEEGLDFSTGCCSSLHAFSRGGGYISALCFSTMVLGPLPDKYVLGGEGHPMGFRERPGSGALWEKTAGLLDITDFSSEPPPCFLFLKANTEY